MQISELAVTKVREMAKSQNLEDHALRVMVVGGGCSGLTYDMDFEEAQKADDWVLEFHGLKILVDPMSYEYLDGTHIDYVESFQFTGFHFENPNATRTCGCGSSFSV